MDLIFSLDWRRYDNAGLLYRHRYGDAGLLNSHRYGDAGPLNSSEKPCNAPHHLTVTSFRFRAHSSYHLPRGRGCKQNHRAAPQSYITKGDAALADSSDEAIPLLAAALVQVHLNDGLSAPTATLVQ